MARVIDFAWGRPGVAALKAAGAVAVCRYLSYDTSGKTLTKGEADILRAGGIDVVSNWEQAGSWNEFSGGQTTGRSHAAEANRQHIACGGPPGRPIYFSTDWNVTSTQMGAVAEYYRGVASVIGLNRTGAYGGYPVIKYLFDQGVITWGWQTFAWSSFRDDPSGQIYLHWDPRAQLRQVKNSVQVGGVDCDLDDSQAADFGQWGMGMGSEMEQGDTVIGWFNRGNRVGDVLADLENFRDEFCLGPGQHSLNPPSPESRFGRLMRATDVILSGKLDDILASTAADLAEAKAATAAVSALAAALTAGGGSVDAAAIITAVQQAGQTESAAVSRLSDQLVAAQGREDALQARLAAALAGTG